MSIAAPEERRRPVKPVPLARPGWNCTRKAHARHFAVLVDGAEYFRAVRHALLKARRSVLMLGWEFDSRTRLVRDGADPHPDRIGPLLEYLVRRNPRLDVRALIWDSALIYALNREFAGIIKMGWLTPRGLHFRLDDSHPLGASHHQKIVVVDESLAFIGGLDITSQRWDSRDHQPDDPRRHDPGYPDYPPFHDVMAVVTGPAARALGDICRDRWRAACGETLVPVMPNDPLALWPPGLSPLMENVEVALSRTATPWDGEPGTREVERLYLDMIATARNFIYLENQYFASRSVAAALGRRLAAPDCPEIVIVNPGQAPSLMERSTMGVARARLVRALQAADPHGRLRLYFPSVGGRDVKVHSKLMIADDRLLRIGSANLNNRSMGLDSECDLLVEAGEDRAVPPAIRALRHDLMAEHLGATPDEVAAAEAKAGSLHGAIARLGRPDRRLVPLDCTEPSEIVRLIADSHLPDPEEPVETLVMIGEAMPGPARRPLDLRLWALVAVLVSLTLAVALWRWAPVEWWRAARPWLEALVGLRREGLAPVMAVGLFLLGGLVRVPLLLLVLATSAALGPWQGTLNALVGAVASAVLLYGMGRAAGRARIRRLAGWKINRVRRALSRHGILAMVLLRLVPVAPFSVINLVAGASGVRLRDFVIGTALGMAPGILAVSVLGDRMVAALRLPSTANIVTLVAATTLVVALQFSVVNRLGRARAPGPGRRQR